MNKVDPNQNSLEFFENFFEKNGFISFRKNFFNIHPKDWRVVTGADTNNATITYEILDEKGVSIVIVKHFDNVLYDKMKEEFLRFKQTVEYQIDQYSTEGEVKLFVKKLLYRIKYINDHLQLNKLALKHPANQKTMNGLVRHIFTKHEPFAKELLDDEYFSKIVQPQSKISINQSTIPSSTTKINPGTFFKWIGNSEENIPKLWKALTFNEYIAEDTTIEALNEAFSGNSIEKPLNIPWIKDVKGRPSKPLIFFFVEELMSLKLIEQVPKNFNLYKKAALIFSDENGNELVNLKESYSSYKKRAYPTPQELELRKVIAAL